MQFQKQLFGDPDKRVFDPGKLVEKFVIDMGGVGRSIFLENAKMWMLCVDGKILKGKGTRMGLEEDMTADDTGPNDWLLQGMILEGTFEPIIGMDLMNNRAIAIIETREESLIIQGFGLTKTYRKKIVRFNWETEKWEVEQYGY